MIKTLILTLLLSLSSAACFAAPASPVISLSEKDLSFRNEIQRAIDRGLMWLRQHQQADGHWSTADQPAVTALAFAAAKGDPKSKTEPDRVKKGYGFILSCVRADGGIHQSNLVTYNTSLCMMALLAANKPEYDPILRNARRFLAGLQRDFDEKGKTDNVFDGGIGYGSHYEHSDMGNTSAALEALYYTKHLFADKK